MTRIVVHGNTLTDYAYKLSVIECLARLQVFDYHTFFYNDGYTIVYEH